MREAVADAYRDLTGSEPDFIFSGWGEELTEGERAAYENRTPSEEYYKEWLVREAAPALLGALERLYTACDTPWCKQSRDEMVHTLCDAEAERFQAEWEQVMIDAGAALRQADGGVMQYVWMQMDCDEHWLPAKLPQAFPPRCLVCQPTLAELVAWWREVEDVPVWPRYWWEWVQSRIVALEAVRNHPDVARLMENDDAQS
ncbi:hypothetical protein DQK91_19095 [Oceanidesulfovibrio marinus]|uniref:Uncharacterized protein n=2 Tax=Oceanidesulfovibrio marinus TaxID=370038 RepID=A0A6P1ZDW4_9BACT|nr:hypothetical protein DQK91_19095 [Oceanidesulfovibrio marinus]